MGVHGETGDMELDASQQLPGCMALAKSLAIHRSICSVGCGPEGPRYDSVSGHVPG